ncbi:MAG: L-histidine N(alpha)-methyltransferase [Terracidiphilus sp.]
MTAQVVLPIADEVLDQVATAVRLGLTAQPKSLPPWLFYDEAGSLLFEQITELPSYYLTRVERGILAANSSDILAQAGDTQRLRVVELGAGSAFKTRVLLQAAIRRQSSVIYEPVDVSFTALEAACQSIDRDMPEVQVVPRVMDYTSELEFESSDAERRLVLYIGSSIGNFEPDEALRLLRRVRSRLRPGDGLLLGVDLAKDEVTLLAAYDDPERVTAAFNLNILNRLNHELGANFDLGTFAHRALWNPAASRIEMHLESRSPQSVRIPALDLEIDFAEGETIHTENSYKFPPGGAEALLSAAGFTPIATWTDQYHRFDVTLGQVE